MTIVDQTIDGMCCSKCGQYFAEPTSTKTLYVHGYPVLCDECFDNCTQDERTGLKRAEVDTFNNFVI